MLIKHKCAYCNKEYETDTYYSKYCSDTCRDLAEEKRKQEYAKTKTRICAFCGKEFQVWKLANGNYSHTKYCSDVCSKLGSSNAEQINEHIYKIKSKDHFYYFDTKTKKNFNYCKACGKPFELINQDNKKAYDLLYCSPECSSRTGEIFAREYEKTNTRICAFCGKEFQVPRYLNGKFSHTIFCSDNCRYLGRSKSQNAAQSQREATCLKKYGVIYPCLTSKCRDANYNIVSNINIEFEELLQQHNINYSREFVLGKYAYDFKVENTLIEINPTYTHSVLGNHFNDYQYRPEFEHYHKEKTEFAKQNNYNCINIWDWDDWTKIIMFILPKQKIFARKLQLKEISKQEANEFLDSYHSQNRCKGNSINLGLYHENKLIQVMTFGKPRYNKNYEWELLRLCTKAGFYVVGGAERLFKYFIQKNKPESILSYCDMSKFKGNVYERLGFTLFKENKPQKIWTKGVAHVTDSLLRQRGFDQLFKTNYGKGTNNEQLMIEHGWRPIYDCGQNTYVWKSSNII